MLKRKLGQFLDEASSSSSSSDDDECDVAPVPEDQSVLMALLGRWHQDDHLRSDLAPHMGDDDIQSVLESVERVRHMPLTPQTANDAFMDNDAMGLAYLLLFPLRQQYYERHHGHKPRRGQEHEPVPFLAHSDVSVCCPNPSGLAGPAVREAVRTGTRLFDLGCAEAAYLASAPSQLVAAGYEINADPLLMSALLRNVQSFRRRRGAFFFAPVSFTEVTIRDDRCCLFSWHPGSHRCPRLASGTSATAYFAATRFDNIEETGLELRMSSSRVQVYTNHDEHVQQEEGFERPRDEGPLIETVNGFPLEQYYDEKRAAKLEAARGKKQGEHARAAWTLTKVKWRFLKEYLARRAANDDVRTLLTAGIPQRECKARIAMWLVTNSM